MTGPSSATSKATSISPYKSFTKVCLNQFEAHLQNVARLEDELCAREERPRATKR